MGTKLTQNAKVTTSKVSIKNIISNGCQIEYTRFLINEQEWLTFGLEWFGDNSKVVVDEFINQLLGDTKLEVKDSIGYN